jgi:hypothetical protein
LGDLSLGRRTSQRILHRKTRYRFWVGRKQSRFCPIHRRKAPLPHHQGFGFNSEALLFSSADDNTDIELLTNNQNFKLYELKDAILAILHGQSYVVPKKSIYLEIREGIAANFQHGITNYLRLRESGRGTYDFAAEPFDLINTSKYLMRRNKFDDALAVFEISTTFLSVCLIARSPTA